MEAGGGNASTVRLPVVGERTVVPHDPKMYLTRGGLLMEVARNSDTNQSALSLDSAVRFESVPRVPTQIYPAGCGRHPERYRGLCPQLA
jgi:hypothetical protein